MPGPPRLLEIYASTKPCPEWWSEMDDSNMMLRRRKSLGDTRAGIVIFACIDTPWIWRRVIGKPHFLSRYPRGIPLERQSNDALQSLETITPVVHDVESHLQRMNSNTLRIVSY